MSQTPLTRREFLQSTAVAGTGAALAHVTPSLFGQVIPATDAVPAWASEPMRWAQLTLVEDDPAHFDPCILARLFQAHPFRRRLPQRRRLRRLLSHRVPFHHRSAWLDNRDVLGELITGCRKLGMSVLVRTDPHATYDDAKAAHPDWIAVDAQGNPRRHWSSPEMWVTCALGPYNFEFMNAVHKEIMTALPRRTASS